MEPDSEIPELPNPFEIPQSYRQSLPAKVQEWLGSVEERIDGLTLERIDQEASSLGLDSAKPFLLGRRLFYKRCQEIIEIMHPGAGIEVGIDLIWIYSESTIPGAAVSEALNDADNINRHYLSLVEEELASNESEWAREAMSNNGRLSTPA